MPNYLPSQSSTLQPSITKRCRTKQQKDEFPRIPAKFVFLTPEVSLFEKNSSFETISDFSFKEDLLTNKEFSGLVPNNFWCHRQLAELFSYFKGFKCDRTEQILASFFSHLGTFDYYLANLLLRNSTSQSVLRNKIYIFLLFYKAC